MNTQLAKIPFEFGLACDVGRKRKGEPNQDAAELVLPEPSGEWQPPLLLIADGMGGSFGGAVASRLIVRTFQDEYRRAQHPTNYLELMEYCLHKAHDALKQCAEADPKLAHMGSTLVALILESRKLYMLNVGDSRAYIIREKNMIQISQDQSWVAAQMRAGIPTPREARMHPNRSRLTMSVTPRRAEVECYKTEESLDPGNIVLLCSDGLWGVVPESLIWSAAVELSPQTAADKMVALANRSQGPDNISVIVARREETV